MILRRDNVKYVTSFCLHNSAKRDTCISIRVKNHSNVPSKGATDVSYKNPVRERNIAHVICSFTLENDITHICIPSFSDLNAHMKVHERQPENRHKRCPWCPLTFKHEINYQRHMKTHKKTTQQISGVFTCDFCAKVFTSSKGAYLRYTLQ